MRPSMRLPGIGLLLTLVSLAVQLLSLTVLPWLRLTAAEPGSATTPKVWQLVADLGTQGFSGWYVVLFSYPLAVLSIVLALASVLESVAMKMIWAGLSLLGLGWLAVRYGVLPLTDGGGEGFTRPQLVVTAVAIVALVLVIFMLRTAVATFRRLAGLILLGIAGVHIAAIADLAGDPAGGLNLGAYGPALAYLLAAIAAFIGPRRLVGG